jgi:hypothetical protein
MYLRKITYQISWNPFSDSRVFLYGRTDIQTDMRLIVAFRNFAECAYKFSTDLAEGPYVSLQFSSSDLINRKKIKFNELESLMTV